MGSHLQKWHDPEGNNKKQKKIRSNFRREKYKLKKMILPWCLDIQSSIFILPYSMYKLLQQYIQIVTLDWREQE